MADERTPSQTVAEQVAADYIDYKVPTLRKWRQEGRGPAYIRIGRSIRYRIPDLDAFLGAHRVQTQHHDPEAA